MEKTADLRAKRDAVREYFLDVYAATAFRVKAEFPRNRASQELFFDSTRPRMMGWGWACRSAHVQLRDPERMRGSRQLQRAVGQ